MCFVHVALSSCIPVSTRMHRLITHLTQTHRPRLVSKCDAPDVYRCACRGLSEELGLTENSDFSASDILFLGFGLDTEYYMCGLRGLIKSSKTAHEIIKNWQIGVKDKMENKKLFAIPFTPEDVCEFVLSHEPWGGGALMGIYHTLVHEFGREHVHSVIASY